MGAALAARSSAVLEPPRRAASARRHSALKFHTPVSAKQCIALLVSYLGVCVMFGHDVTVVGPHVALGSALVLASAVSYALYLVYSGQALKRLGALHPLPRRLESLARCRRSS